MILDKSFIKSHIISIVKDGDEEGLDLIAKIIIESEEAKQILRGKGYGWTGLSLVQTAKEIESNNFTMISKIF